MVITNGERALGTVLVTGGAGFIGVNFIRQLLAEDSRARVVNLDALTYAGCPVSLDGLAEAYPGRYEFVAADIRDAAAVGEIFARTAPDTVVHFAAESHVDRSIDGPEAFLTTNILGTYTLLQAARTAWNGRADARFHHVSTDEVYGSLGPEGLFTEETPYDPRSPYSASKAASDHLVRAWSHTYGLPVTLSNCSNNYGPYQFPEKLLPLMIAKARAGEKLPVYGDGSNVRDWLHVEDHCRAIGLVLRRGQPGRTYNVGGRNEWRNLDTVRLLCDLLQELSPRPGGGHYREQIAFVTDRPGHDPRYAIDPTRIETELGWRSRYDFAAGLRATIEWYLAHPEWVAAAGERYAGQRLGEKR